MLEYSKNMFEFLFSVPHLVEYFETKLLHRNGGGRDNMSPSTYWQIYKNNTSHIAEQCTNETYKFSPYKEQLIIKGRNKYPRCISIPTVKDRLVLGVLNEYLQFTFPECVNHDTPNLYIRKIRDYIFENQEHQIWFFKSDFSNFYDSVSQTRLINKLHERISDKRVIKLIVDAITNPTIGMRKERYSENTKGIPQGLAISNILAAIYMSDFDTTMSECQNVLFLRYVDDILVLSTYQKEWNRIIEDIISTEKLNITLSKEKTSTGIIGEKDFEYIGYKFQDKEHISVREQNVDLFVRRLAHTCTLLKKQIATPALRPRFINNETELIEYFAEDLNELISGLKYESTLYGWLPYFQEMTDIQLLYRLDKIVRRLVSKIGSFDYTLLHSFVASYYDIHEHSGKHLVKNYDSMQDTAEKKNFLKKKGRISADQAYSDEQINEIYRTYCDNRRKAVERHIGYWGK